MFISDDVKDLIDDIEINFINWNQWQYEFVNESKGTRIWTANGAMFIDINNARLFNIFEKLAIKKAIRNSIISKTVY